MAQPGAGRELDDDYLEVAVRAWAVRSQPTGDEDAVTQSEDDRPATRPPAPRVPEHFLIFDTETTTDSSQRLLFGCWRYLRANHDDGFRLDTVEEGIFYPDDLAQWDAEGYGVVEEIQRSRLPADVARGHLDARPMLSVVGLESFLERQLWRAAYELHGALVCFNFPFDISRLAWQAGQTRNPRPKHPDPFEGGFSLRLWGRQRAEKGAILYRPRVAVKSLDSKRALKAFRSAAQVDEADLVPDDEGRTERGKGSVFRGHLLDLRTLVFALTDRGHTLESACNAFGMPYTKRDVEHGRITPEYVDYCREDVEATTRLCEAAVAEFLKHPIDLQATRAFSPATIGKGYLKKMGVRPLLKRQAFDPTVLGWAMSAYYGGRAECRIRRTRVPVAYCDFLSMYPTVCSLMHLWELLTAESVQVDEDAVGEVQALLNEISLDDCFRPERWPELVGIAEIEPADDILPVRARYGSTLSWQIGVNPLTSSEPMWFTIPDLVGSKLLTGRAPRVRRAVRFRPSEGRTPGLQPVELLGMTLVDPVQQDFFGTVVEERRGTEARTDLPPLERAWRSTGLKVLANATSYGIYAQMTRHELAGGRRENVAVHGRGDETYSFPTAAPEDPGEFAFPPMAAAITGGARLLLALLERRVTDEGGTYAFCDTDSMAIVATQHGGPIACPGGGDHRTEQGEEAVKALSWAEVDVIRADFEALKPYNRKVVKDDLLELEGENYVDLDTRTKQRELWCYAISAKRYVLFDYDRQGKPVLRGWSEFDAGVDAGEPEEPPERLLKPSEHGLGHLLNPVDAESESRDWIEESWKLVLRADPWLPEDGPVWLERPAVARSSVSSPFLLRLFQELNDGKPYDEQIKPFNFMLTTFVPRGERPADDQRMVLVAPFETQAERWLEMPWVNRYSQRQYHLTEQPFRGFVRPGIVRPRTYRDILSDYLANPEAKSLAPDGALCAADTAGLLARRPVRLATLGHIGKESNRLEDVQAGLVEGLDEVVNQYDDFYARVFAPLALPVLQRLGVRETARRADLAPATVSVALRKGSRPRPRHVQRLFAVAADEASDQLRASGISPGGDAVTALRRYAESAVLRVNDLNG